MPTIDHLPKTPSTLALIPSQYNILIIDDDEDIRKFISAVLGSEGYETDTAACGEEGLVKLKTTTPDLIMLDMFMPDHDGLTMIKMIRSAEINHHIPIVVITAFGDRDVKIKCLEYGAEDFLNKPLDYAELLSRVNNLLRIKSYNDLLKDYNQQLEERVEANTKRIRKQCIDTVLTLTRAAEYRDENTGCHVTRISYYSRELAQRMGLSDEFCEQIFYASPMHDIGKLAIPDYVLLKRHSLNEQEWQIMKSHTTLGRNILKGNDSPYLEMGGEIAQSHHERWDGTGYPAGLKGEEIPLAARIMSICDVYDALRSKRPYKPYYTHSETVSIIKRGDHRTQPSHFDPEVHDMFLSQQRSFEAIFEDQQIHVG